MEGRTDKGIYRSSNPEFKSFDIQLLMPFKESVYFLTYLRFNMTTYTCICFTQQFTLVPDLKSQMTASYSVVACK